jgi:hypothetical protein
MGAEDFNTLTIRHRRDIQLLQEEMQENKSAQSKYQQYMKSGINFPVNLNHTFQKADIPTRQHIFHSISPE